MDIGAEKEIGSPKSGASGPKTRSRHAAELLSRPRLRPRTRSQGPAPPSIEICTQQVIQSLAEKREASRARKTMNKALGIPLVSALSNK